MTGAGTRLLLRKLARDIARQRGPFTAAGLVAASGFAVFVSMRSMHAYLTSAQASTYREGRFAHLFAHLERAPEGVAVRLLELPGVSAAETRIVAEAVLDVPGLEEPATGRLVSIPEAGPRLNRLTLRRGRWPAPGAADEVLVSDAFARANGLVPGDRLRAALAGRRRPLTIAGTAMSPEFVYEIRGGAEIFPDNRRFGVIWMPRRTLGDALGLERSFNDVVLLLAPGGREPDVIARVDRVLAPYGGTGAYGRRDHASHRFLTDEIEETRVTSLFLPAVFFGVTAFLLHLTVSRLVSAQREQIAVLRAFGYGAGPIGAHYLEMALAPVAAGALAGLPAGAYLASLLAGVYRRFYQLPGAEFTLDPTILVAALLLGAASAALGAWGSVRRVLALMPAEAMQPVSPPSYGSRTGGRRPGRRTSLLRLLVWRGFARRPARAFLSSLGIAAAMAMVLAGLFAFDAIDTMRDVQFTHVEREDVTVAFRDRRSPASRHELARLPGVLRVEAIRTVPVVLRRGARHVRTVLTGLAPDGELRRVVDGAYRSRRPEPGGLLLSAYQADRLGLAPGDVVRVEVTEGDRPVGDLRVTGVVAEVIGAGAYLELETLHRLMRESAVLSGAALRVEPGARRRLWSVLKRRPGVSSVAVRDVMRASFDRTVAESFRISLASIVGFACLIAAGVVYNGARISLSERARELASLRVLGFTRREVASVLLVEQGSLTLAALPLGTLLGALLCWLMVRRFEAESFRLPFDLRPGTVAVSGLVVLAAAAVSAWAVTRRAARTDLVEVLKVRE